MRFIFLCPCPAVPFLGDPGRGTVGAGDHFPRLHPFPLGWLTSLPPQVAPPRAARMGSRVLCRTSDTKADQEGASSGGGEGRKWGPCPTVPGWRNAGSAPTLTCSYRLCSSASSPGRHHTARCSAWHTCISSRLVATPPHQLTETTPSPWRSPTRNPVNF